MLYDSISEAQAAAQHAANKTHEPHVVWVRNTRYRPFAFVTRDNADSTRPAPFGWQHWSNHKPNEKL